MEEKHWKELLKFSNRKERLDFLKFIRLNEVEEKKKKQKKSQKKKIPEKILIDSEFKEIDVGYEQQCKFFLLFVRAFVGQY